MDQNFFPAYSFRGQLWRRWVRIGRDGTKHEFTGGQLKPFCCQRMRHIWPHNMAAYHKWMKQATRLRNDTVQYFTSVSCTKYLIALYLFSINHYQVLINYSFIFTPLMAINTSSLADLPNFGRIKMFLLQVLMVLLEVTLRIH